MNPFVKLVSDLRNFRPEVRQQAVELAALHDPTPVAPKPVMRKAKAAKPATAAQAPAKRRGRKPGSKNKPKQAPADPVSQSFHQAAENV